MSLEKRKIIAADMVRSLPDGHFGEVRFAPKFRAWTLTSGDLALDVFLHRVSLFGNVFDGRPAIDIDTVTGEEDRVFVQFRVTGTLITGATYRQNAAFMVEFDDQDRIRHWREYFDSRLVAELLFPAMQKLEAERAEG